MVANGFASRHRTAWFVVLMILMCSCFAISPQYAWANVASGTMGGVAWHITDDGELVIGDGSDNQSMGFSGNPDTGSRNDIGWADYRESIRKVSIDGHVSILDSMYGFFSDCRNLESVDFSGLNTSRVKYMTGMFTNCSKLSAFDMSSINIGSVTNMDSMFAGCSSLRRIEFYGCNVGRIKSMRYIFSNCSSLEYAGFTGCNFASLSADAMFGGCTGLQTVDFSAATIASVGASSGGLFGYAGNGRPNSVCNFNSATIGGQLPNGFFAGCNFEKLTCIELTFPDTTSVVGLFSGFKGKTLDTSGMYIPNATDASGVFSGCSNLTSFNLGFLNNDKITNMREMFSDCDSVKTLDLRRLDVSHVTNAFSMIVNCDNLETVRMSNLNFADLVSSSGPMIYNNPKLSVVDLSGVYLRQSNFPIMYYCGNLSSLILTGCDMSGGGTSWSQVPIVSNCGNSSDSCSLLCNNAKFGTKLKSFLYDCYFTSVDFTGIVTNDVTDMSGLFSGCKRLREIVNLRDLDTGNVTSMASMFGGCEALTSLDLSRFDTSHVGDMIYMFRNCSGLSIIDLSNFVIGSNTVTQDMFLSANPRTLILGPDCTFSTGDPSLRAHVNQSGYTPLWINTDKSDLDGFTSLQLTSEYDGSFMSGTWVWQHAGVNVTFDPNGGIGSMDRVYSDYVNPVSVPDSEFSRYDHDFAGWNTKSDGSGVAYAVGSQLRDTSHDTEIYDLKLYAQWNVRDHSVTLDDGGFDIVMPAGYRAVIDGLPAGVTYVVTETAGSGWQQIDASDTSGSIPANDMSESTFVNQYVPGTTYAQISGVKLLDGSAAKREFMFGLFEGDELLQVAASSDGAILFDPIVYDEVGTHEYVVKEMAGSDSALSYDSSEYRVRVNIVDNGGSLSSEVSYLDGPMRFSNRTNPGDLLLSKLGRGLSDVNGQDAFTFKIRLTNGIGMPLDSLNMHVVHREILE